MEGSLGEIEHGQRVDKGILIHVRREELEILCTKERYVDTLMKKLYKEGKINGWEEYIVYRIGESMFYHGASDNKKIGAKK